MENVLAILLARGLDEQLDLLTRYTAKASVPFGGAYRMVDFTLSNCVNSDLKRTFILAQSLCLDWNCRFGDSWKMQNRVRGYSGTNAGIALMPEPAVGGQ